MRFLLILILAIAFSVSAFSQLHYDNNWLMSDINGAVLVSFNDGYPEVDSIDLPMKFKNYSVMMSNEVGQLQFYSNGCKVFNASHQLMENGDTLNFGEIYEDYCSEGNEFGGYPSLSSGMVGIPQPHYPNCYYIIHKSLDWFPEPIPNESLAFLSRLYLAKIDMSANHGEGKVMEKHILVDDRMAEHELILNRHANGEDWWAISPLKDTNQYAVYLIDSVGAELMSIQEIGIVDDRWSRGGGQSKFGPNGEQLVRWNTVSGLQLFDFDRETGMLSNFEFYPSPLQNQQIILAGGVGISPSGQFAYVSTVKDIYQYDLWADDIGASRVPIAVVGNPDSLWIGIAPTAFDFQLGPDCKLYCYTNTGYEHHVIHQPDERGLACEWEQGGLDLLGVTIFRDTPHFPNYRLGKLGEESNQCVGPIVSVAPPLERVPTYLSVYPNPVRSREPVSLSLGGTFPYHAAQWRLYDAAGRLVTERPLTKGEVTRVPIPAVPAGTYFWELRGDNALVNQGKLVLR